MGQPHHSPTRGKEGETGFLNRFRRGFLRRDKAEEVLRRRGGKERAKEEESGVKGGWTTMDDDHGRRPQRMAACVDRDRQKVDGDGR